MSDVSPDVSVRSPAVAKVSKRSRRKAQALKFKRSMEQQAAPVRGFDLRRIEATDIDTIELDAGEHTVTVSIQVPMGDNEAFAEYEEILDFDDETTPGYLAAAAKQFGDAVLRAVKERVFTSGRNPCETCTGACCGRQFSQVRVTQADVDRLTARGLDVSEHIDFYESQSFTGYVGQLRLVPWPPDEEQTACPFLGEDGCAVYQDRPLVCREFSPWTCEFYEEDPEKTEGNVQLRVVRGEPNK